MFQNTLEAVAHIDMRERWLFVKTAKSRPTESSRPSQAAAAAMGTRLFLRSARLVGGILFVFDADVLVDIGIRKKLIDETDRDGFRENLRVRSRYSHVDVAEIAALKALYDAHVHAVSVAASVQPTKVVESDRRSLGRS